MVTPIWDKAESHDLSAYEGTPYHVPLSKFTRLITDDGRSGHTPEHIGRYTHPLLLVGLPFPGELQCHALESECGNIVRH